MAAGHRVTAVGRDIRFGRRALPDARWLGADIAHLDAPEKWAPLLRDVDVVVNASGALQDGVRDNLFSVQDTAIRALVAACETAGLACFVQISAPGANERADTNFLRTKAAADDALKASTLSWVILRPGLVWGRTASGGTALVRMLSAFPMVQPLVLAHAQVQLVDIDDVTAAIVAASNGETRAGSDLTLLEPAAHSLAGVVAKVRAWHGFPDAKFRVDLPPVFGGAIARLADLAGWLGWRSPLRTTSLRALERGVVGEPSVPLGSFDAILKQRPATRQDRLFARMQLLLPLVVLCLAGFWIVSGVLDLMATPAAAETLPESLPNRDIYVRAGSFADLALGLAVLWRPWARAACFGMIALTGGYLVAGTALAPQLWADPLGPFVKALPAAMLALVCAAMLEER
jgi:uncharacterized protein YbjT (DUF2867 family)/uncharacterized membrane protein